MREFEGRARYLFRRIRGRLLCFGICLIVLLVSAYSFLSTAIENHSFLLLTEKATANEVVFSGANEGGEAFISLNGKNNLLNDDGFRLNADLFMALSGASYRDNPIGFEGALSEGECFVSGDLMKLLDLKLGDRLTTTKDGIEYRISGILPAQEGWDEEYDHEGVIVLAYHDALALGAEEYVSFIESGEQYSNLRQIIFIENMQKAALDARQNAFLKALAVMLCAIALSEWLLGKRARRDYFIMAFDGVSPPGLYRRIAFDLAVKYFSSVCAVGIVVFFRMREYGEAGREIILPYVAMSLIALLFAAAIERRISTCQKK